MYIDDAHGVGILSSNCRGIVGTKGINPKDIDVLMGTYSKAFASNGGFIAGSKVRIYARICSYIVRLRKFFYPESFFFWRYGVELYNHNSVDRNRITLSYLTRL